MKKWKTLIFGVFLGIILMLVSFVSYHYIKNKQNYDVISVKNAVESLGNNSSTNTVAYSTRDTVHIKATYFQTFGDDAKYERFPVEFYQPKLSGDYYSFKIKKKDSLYVEKYTTSIRNISNQTPITNLLSVTIDSLAKEPIFMRNKYYKVNDKKISENITLDVSKNKFAVITYLSGEQYFGICTPIFINDKCLMFSLIFNRINGYLMKTKEGWEGKIGEIDFTSKHFEEYTDEYNKEMQALNKLKKQTNRPLYSNENNFVIRNGQLFTSNFSYPLLKTTMDTLYFTGQVYNKQLIIGEKNKKKYLFNGLLQNITPNNFQAISNNDNEYFSVISNHQIFTITDRGKLGQPTTLNKQNKVKQTDFYKYMIVENDTTFNIVCKRYEDDSLIETYKTTATLKPKATQDILFINNRKEIIVNTDEIDQKQNFLITRKNDLYGLWKFNNLIVEHDNYENNVEEIVVNIKLTALLPHYYTQLFADEMTQLVFFENNGLEGYYPLQTEGRYKKLGSFINKSFTRFTLTNGKKGWLQHNGKEYLD